MEKIYANSEEKYLKAVVLYAIQATGGNSIEAVGGNSIGLFYDAEGTQQAHNSDYDWKDLFFKGLIRVSMLGDGSSLNINNFYAPYRLMADSEGFALQLYEGIPFANFFADEENGSTDGEDGSSAVAIDAGK